MKFEKKSEKEERSERRMGSLPARRLTALLCACLLFGGIAMTAAGCAPAKERYQKSYLDAFDTAITIVGYTESEEEFTETAEFVHEELLRYHRLYDIYNEYNGMNNVKTINRNAGVAPVAVDSDLIALLRFYREIETLSEGRVNVAMGNVLEIWHKYRNEGINYPERAKLPDAEELREAAAHCGIDGMVIDEEAGTVYLTDPEMSLDVGAIAKGYATERIAQELAARGADNFVMNVGGNVRAVGSKADGSQWVVGIQNPDLTSEETTVETVAFSDLSLATSGVYQRYYTVDGQNYHHIIDRDTLMPENRYLSVSVLTADSGLADAMSTALFNMDYEEGRAFAERFSPKDFLAKADGAVRTEADTAGDDALADVFEIMWVMPDGEKRYTDGFKDYIVTE